MGYQMNYFPTGAHSVYFNIAYDSCLVAAPQMPIAGFPAELNHSSELSEQKEESKLHKSRVYRKIYNNGACPYGSVPNKKSLYWKTKICHKWLSTGDCPYGIQCCYAHGDAELRKPTKDYDALVKKQVAAAPSKSVAPNLAEDMLSKAKNEPGKPACLLESHNKIRALGLKKIDRIYGDWI